MAQPFRHDGKCAIFIHAGAGFHSLENERKHLEACDKAATKAMAFLRNGATAIDAVEVALMILEDNPITNAGYGSNLNERGAVECDAVIVDHHGHSGAAGAVQCGFLVHSVYVHPNSEIGVKNPIMLARKIYDRANLKMGMSRVPPNFLVGKGAQDFAWDHGVITIPDEGLIAPVAEQRYKTWAAEVEDYERDNEFHEDPGYWCRPPLTPLDERIQRLEKQDLIEYPERHDQNSVVTPDPEQELKSLNNRTPPVGGKGRHTSSPSYPPRRKKVKLSHESSVRQSPYSSDLSPSSSLSPDGSPERSPASDKEDSSTDDREDREDSSTDDKEDSPANDTNWENEEDEDEDEDEDLITDTIGAIAIDRYGNIAAGSSSGGIGMKHRGRIGPAALIGIGSHVIPEDMTDPEGTTCAVVTSGTGELIAGTLAASTCAQRMYYSQKMGPNGTFTHVLEEDAIKSWMKKEFMVTLLEHPVVANSFLFGAIGVMVVKKTNSGVELYFAHNTDSFALASFSSNAARPSCLMSRGKRGTIAQGGCRIKFDTS
ncbi:unnamed protein product [Penicillium salamii]|uniref:Asparaginase n=1 Tax=Penicillium salamii TaxID=1612424 RepID=A0A9W4N6D9_9EURO|nr:unnamed protein product [Penicillium salamii]CAG8254842.1 unnamed protein product [Penicillium salamii]CAG8278502.1 unnamed protein product [Penicillium salamii]CAG8297114.1 unnamed protein product [Penicillium salamii]CAG8389726.1 unnamed protein product [Penicillium salamii]